jgi:hypothetical protein
MRTKCIGAVVLCAAFAVAGCHKAPKHTPVVAVPPAPLPAPTSAPAPSPPPPPAPPPPPVSPLEAPDRAFAAGNYDEAARGYENYLRGTSGGLRDQALFHLALTYALRPAPATDWPHAMATLKQLLEEYPDSTFRAQANLILGLRADLDQAASDVRQREQRLKQLTTELDRLKRIDADRRKRP